MRKLILVLCSILLVFMTADFSSALVIADGTFDLSLPGPYTVGSYNYSTSYTDPVTGDTISVDKYFARINNYLLYSPYSSSGIAVGMGDDYTGSGSYLGSSVSGTYNALTGSETFGLSAVASGPGVAASVNVDFYSYAYYHGVLDDFSYSYSFTGQKDNADNSLQFMIQMSIEGLFDDGWKDVYSDYGTYYMVYDTEEERLQHYLTNWVNESVTDVGVNINIDGTRTFDFSAFGERDWQIRWDFMANGYDKSGCGDPSEVPEPSTLILIGSGLAGVGLLRRRFKS